MDVTILKNVIIEIPITQIGIMAFLCVLLSMLGKYKLSICAVFGFIIYWVFILNKTKFGFSQEAELMHTGLFIIISIVFVGIGAWMIFMDK